MVGGMDVEGHLRTIFRRCVQCPPGPPSCPSCASDETCSLKAESCTSCASTSCVKLGSLPGQADTPAKTPMGAIAGGVVGGVAVIAILTYLVWRYGIRNRRRDDQAWMDQKIEKRDPSTLARGARQSTAASIASTVLTRASNVIQIAYIPGVTNRTPPHSPSQLIPPVPRLPFGSTASSAVSTPRMEQDMHFFMPGDLRDSTYSAMTDDQRISLAPSLARASVATTMYRNDAIVSPFPAQQVFRTKPAVVSVKSGSSTPGDRSGSESRNTNTPPVPKVPGQLGSSIVGRTFTARPVEVKKANSGTRVPTLSNLARANSTAQQSIASPMSDISGNYWDEKEVVGSPSTIIEDSSPISPFVQPKPSFTSFHSGPSSPMQASSPSRSNADAGLNAMIEDAMKFAAREPTHMGLGGSRNASRPELRKQDSGPFSDSNEVRENFV